MNKLMFNFWAEPFARYVLAIREVAKKLSFLRTGLSEEGRFRTELNIAGTNTGRSSSASSAFGDGSNLQNVDTTLRYPFIADEGMLLVNVDLEQADARNVGAIIYTMAMNSDERLPSGEWVRDYASGYLDACESGDTHSMVAKLSWPELDWPESFNDWKAFCDNVDVYPGVSYRQAAKKLGHATNYMGKPRSIAERTHIALPVVEAFQPRYFRGFPLIPWWQQKTIQQIKETGTLITPYGRRRHFYGRPDEGETHRAAIAYCPQSMTGEQIDRGITQLWTGMPEAQLLIQVHDSILFQVPYAQHEVLVPRALELLRFPITLPGGRVFEVPLEAKTGYNWGNRLENKKTGKIENEWGLEKWKGKDSRQPPNRKRSIRELIG
jgi:DNA polymerase I-like protein with 3'-5' exonuclease and polymerase domains